MSAELLAVLARGVLAASAAMAIVLALRGPLRAAFGANVAYAFWLVVPIATIASFIPARRVFVEGPPQTLIDAPNAPAFVDPISAQPLYAPIEALGGAGDLTPWVSALWMLGFVVSLALVLLAQQRFLARLGLRRDRGGFHVALGDLVGPAVVGVLAPRIVVPADFDARYTEVERALVLEHERAHIRAGDVQVNALAAFAQCAMWFNPIVYMARAALRIDQELACDERVMQRHIGVRRIYAEAMLKTQFAACAVPLGCAWPPIGAQPLKQRIAMLGRPRLAASRRALGGALCAATTIAAGLAVWAAQPAQVAYGHEEASNAATGGSGARLVQALMEGDTSQARELIAAGADVNHWTPGDGTPLIMAARLDDLDMARALLAAGADVNQAAHGEGNPLIVASARGNVEMVRLFVGAGADVNAIVPSDETALINAAWRNQIEVARYLLNHGADVNLAVDAPTTRGAQRRTPLIMATREGHIEMIRLLQDAGARD